MKKWTSTLAILVLLSSLSRGALGSIPPTDLSIPVPQTPNQSTLDLKSFAPPAGYNDPLVSKATLEKYLPSTLTPTANGQAFETEVGSKVGQKITDDLMKSDFFQKSPTAKMIANVQHATDKSVSLGSPAAGGVVHTFKFQLKAAERIAEVDYTGWIATSLVYTANDNTAKLTFTHPVSKDMTLLFVNANVVGTVDFSPNLSLSYKF